MELAAIIALTAAVAALVVARLLGWQPPDVIDDQRRATLLRKAWRGDFGEAAKKRSILTSDFNFANKVALGVIATVLAAAAVAVFVCRTS